VITAGVSLVLPVAARRVVDHFGLAEAQLLDQYFGAAMVIVLLPRRRGRRCATTS
jgi:ATP-binding cassette subfamily B protein